MLSKEKWLKIAKGAAIAAGGAALAYLSSFAVPAIAESGALGASVAAIAAVVINAARKALEGLNDAKAKA